MRILSGDCRESFGCRSVRERMQQGHSPVKATLLLRSAGQWKRHFTEFLRNRVLVLSVRQAWRKKQQNKKGSLHKYPQMA